MKLSIILPIYNEEKNIPILYAELKKVMGQMGVAHEIICINDGSRDASWSVLRGLAAGDASLKLIDFRINRGQTAALSAGIKCASGEIIIPMDSDLQNDPADIPMLVAKLDEGFDVVSGWRKERWQGSFLTRRLPSLIANKLISIITKVSLHDYGCTMKAYRREIIQGIELYGEMHRFIPAYTAWHGGKVAEVAVNYRVRQFGSTNYGISRTFKVLLDLLVVKFLSKYMDRPIHFFGGLGFISLFLGIFVGATAVALRLLSIKFISETPLPILSALLIIVGVQLIAMGIIAEMLMRTYYSTPGKSPYEIRETVNF